MVKRGRKKYPSRTLPIDIIQNEILVKLPPKPLLKCRSVSKLWCSIIDDPKFSQSHLKEHQETTPHRFLVLEPPDVGYSEQICTIRNCKSFRKMSGHDIELKAWRMFYKVVGYINGVVCLKKYRSKFQLPYKIILWNPSIKKALEIPYPDVRSMHDEKGILEFDIDFAFGYDAVKDDYKVVASAYIGRANRQMMVAATVEIFTLSTFSWKRAQSMYPCVWDLNGPKVFLQGVTYWCGKDKSNFPIKGNIFSHFVSFNAVTEEFIYIDLPDCEEAILWAKDRFPIILDQSIGLMETFETCSYIWIMENNNNNNNGKGRGRAVTWKKLYSINLPLLYKCLHFKIDGELFFTEEAGGVKSYNIKTGEVKLLAKTYKISPVYTDVYKESLALLSGRGVPQGALTFPPSTIPWGSRVYC